MVKYRTRTKILLKNIHVQTLINSISAQLQSRYFRILGIYFSFGNLSSGIVLVYSVLLYTVSDNVKPIS
jgi:hypothetical protein